MFRLSPFSSTQIKKEIADLQKRYNNVVREKSTLEEQVIIQKDDIGNLQQEIERLNELLKKEKATSDDLRNQLKQQEYHITHLTRLAYGQSSEQVKDAPIFSAEVLEDLGLEDFVPADKEAEEILKKIHVHGHTRILGKKRKKKKRSIPRARAEKLPDHLPVVVQVMTPESATCPCCHGSCEHFIRNEVTQKLACSGCPYYILKTIRPVLGCAQCETIAPLAKLNSPYQRSLFHETALAEIIAQKHAWGVPIFRQSQQMQNNGILVSDTHIGNALLAVEPDVRPIVEALKRSILQGVCLADPTFLSTRIQDTNTKKKRYKKCSLFALMGICKEVVFEFSSTMKNEDFAKVYEGVVFPLVTDAAEGFKHIRDLYNLPLALCSSHSRRKFEKALSYKKKKALIAIGFYQKLFAIEEEILQLPPDERLRIRKELSAPLCEKFHTWCEKEFESEPPKTPLSKALKYVLKNWDGLTFFLKDGRVPIHTNYIEQLFRTVAIGRRAFFFAGSEVGAKAMATYYSLVISCLLIDVNPFVYIADVLRRIWSKDKHCTIEDLIPRNWKERFYQDARKKYCNVQFTSLVNKDSDAFLASTPLHTTQNNNQVIIQ